MNIPRSFLVACMLCPVYLKATVVYATNETGFGQMDLNTGVFTQISPESAMNDIGFAPNGVLYAIANGLLTTVNLSTGGLTTIGALPAGSESLAFLNSSEILVLTTPGALYNVNPVTASYSLIGDLPSGASMGGGTSNIRFDPQNGMLYETSYSADSELFVVNPSNASASLIGSTSLTDITLGTFAGSLFYSTAESGANYEVITLDPATAATSIVASTNGIYSFASIPEPDSVLLLAAGLTALCACRCGTNKSQK
jgi:hypothetical protein